MSETTTIVTSIIGSAVGIIAVLGTFLGLMIRSTNRRLDDTNKRFDDTRTDLISRLDETNRRLERVETRVDETNHDIGELRDRTGKLEGAATAFIGNQSKADAA